MNPLGRGNRLRGVTTALIWCLLATGVCAQAAPDQRESAAPPPQEERRSSPASPQELNPNGAETDIESLLRLPRGFVSMSPRAVAGASETEWRRRFKAAKTVLSAAKQTLEATKQELDGVALGGGASQWNVAPPGASNTGSSTSPLSFRLRQQLREMRERLATSEKAMRELRIEADLAGVPVSWRASD